MTTPINESLHGVLMNISDQGILITGQPGSGKSSFALELLHHGYQLVADDSVDFSSHNQGHVIGRCPEMLFGFLHTRELGLLDVTALFGEASLCKSIALKGIIHIDSHHKADAGLQIESEQITICNTAFPRLRLSPHNPASLYHRLQVWLKLLGDASEVEKQLQQRQNKLMAV